MMLALYAVFGLCAAFFERICVSLVLTVPFVLWPIAFQRYYVGVSLIEFHYLMMDDTPRSINRALFMLFEHDILRDSCHAKLS